LRAEGDIERLDSLIDLPLWGYFTEVNNRTPRVASCSAELMQFKQSLKLQPAW
jgi:hypothetical protein